MKKQKQQQQLSSNRDGNIENGNMSRKTITINPVAPNISNDNMNNSLIDVEDGTKRGESGSESGSDELHLESEDESEDESDAYEDESDDEEQEDHDELEEHEKGREGEVEINIGNGNTMFNHDDDNDDVADDDGNGNEIDEEERDVDEIINEYLAASHARYEAKKKKKAKEKELVDGTSGAVITSDDILRRGTFADMKGAKNDDINGDGFNSSDDDDSSDDEADMNTIGRAVPLHWYNEEDHIGYTVDGNKLLKPSEAASGAPGGAMQFGVFDPLSRLINRSTDPNAWRTMYDPYNGKTITLTDAEVKMISRLRKNRFPHRDVDPYPERDFDVSVERDEDGKVVSWPMSNAPEPKRRFLPSKWEAKMVVRMVRAMRRGWMQTKSERIRQEAEREAEQRSSQVFLMWEDGGD